MSLQCLCVKRISQETSSAGSISAKLSAAPTMLIAKNIKAEASIEAPLKKEVNSCFCEYIT